MSSERILIAEDSATQAEALKLILEAEGWSVEVVADGHRALSRVREEPFDLVLADVTMPEMDGYELCRAVRKDLRTRATGLVMLSALDDPAALAEGFRAGVDGWLRKPVEVDELIDELRELLERTRARREVASLVDELGERVDALSSLRERAPEEFAALDDTVRRLRERTGARS